jgi:hydroxyacylglutathione hydrolase
LGELAKGLDKTRPYLLYCAGGYRSMIAASLLKINGIKKVLNLKGGINAYSDVLNKSREDNI